MSILYKYHISPKEFKEKYSMDVSVSILYKYHISLGFKIEREGKIFTCRSFISIIFPVQIETESGHKFMRVSILYKYHISLTKYSTFWTLIAKNVEKRSILTYIFRPPPVFRLFLVFKSAQI